MSTIAARNRFKTFIESGASGPQLLPLGHTLEFARFVNLMASPLVERPTCDVYGEDLAYFFYGRPAYKPSNNGESVSIGAFNLVGLLFPTDTFPPPHRVMPFDSGALHRGFYQHAIPKSLELENFELLPTSDSAPKLVARYFGNNKDYFRGRPDKAIKVPASQVEAACYLALISSQVSTKTDDRRSTVEFQYNVDIDITRHRPIGVIVSDDAADDETIRDFVTVTLGADLIPFATYHDGAFADAVLIREAARRYLEAKGFL